MIQLNISEFEKLQHETSKLEDNEMAEYIGVSNSTVWRIKKGKMQPGPDFISKLLLKFPKKKFEDLFLIT